MKNTKTKQQRLDYFAGLVMQSLILKSKENAHLLDKVSIKQICFMSIQFAEEIINQIDNGKI